MILFEFYIYRNKPWVQMHLLVARYQIKKSINNEVIQNKENKSEYTVFQILSNEIIKEERENTTSNK